MLGRGVNKVVGPLLRTGAEILLHQELKIALPAAVTAMQVHGGPYQGPNPLVSNPYGISLSPVFSTSLGSSVPLIPSQGIQTRASRLRISPFNLEIKEPEKKTQGTGVVSALLYPSLSRSLAVKPTSQLMTREIQQIQEPLTALVARIDGATDINQLLNDFLH
jgi:hypothetical protein